MWSVHPYTRKTWQQRGRNNSKSGLQLNPTGRELNLCLIMKSWFPICDSSGVTLVRKQPRGKNTISVFDLLGVFLFDLQEFLPFGSKHHFSHFDNAIKGYLTIISQD
jgi:hypothetical protein